ncbi:MAG TPA: M14 family zinc carboxypeptidase [Burkholderiales bacterium]|nr:M14 family zinc carboxypeptidase [Burkholderiales bacterium]
MHWLHSLQQGMGLRSRCIATVASIICGLTPSVYASTESAAEPVVDWCKELLPRLPGVSKPICKSSLLTPSGVVSRKGFPILVREIVPAAVEGGESDKEPIRILLLGGVHGDELTSSAIVFRWLKWINGPMARGFHWKIAPVINPDGLLASTPTRVNAHGVDLNRNFPMPDWLHEASNYWVKVTNSDPRRFPGPAPLSEPETQWVNDEIARFRPNVIISIHAPFGLLDYDGPAKPPRRFGRLWFNRLGVYPGSLGNYSGSQMNVPVITIELPHAMVLPSDPEVLRIWQDMLSWIRRNVPKQPSAPPPVPDAIQAEPSSASLVPTTMEQ